MPITNPKDIKTDVKPAAAATEMAVLPAVVTEHKLSNNGGCQLSAESGRALAAAFMNGSAASDEKFGRALFNNPGFKEAFLKQLKEQMSDPILAALLKDMESLKKELLQNPPAPTPRMS